MSTHSLHLLLRKWRSVSWCGWFRMKRWWESLIETSLWQQERCLLPAKLTESRRYMLRGAVKWLFHGRTVNRRYTATDRFYLMRWPDVAEKYWRWWKQMNPKVTSGRWRQEKLMMAQLKVGYLPYFSVMREDKETTKREDSFRFSNQIWQNNPWWYHVAWTLTATGRFWCFWRFAMIL